MAKPEEKLYAQALRRTGLSIKEIARQVGVSRSAVSLWVREITLTDTQRQTLRDNQIAGGHTGRIRGAEMNHSKRIERTRIATEDAEKIFIELSVDQLFYIGLGLYWGEGSKAESSKQVSVTNSDPRVMQLMLRWFVECLDVNPSRFQPRIFISDTHQDREEILLQFWEEKLAIPRRQFGRTIFLPKGKKIYENRDSYYGVLTLRIRKGGAVRDQILAAISRISELSAIQPA